MSQEVKFEEIKEEIKTLIEDTLKKI